MVTINNIVNQEIIESALENKYKRKVDVLGYSLEAVVPAGDNYTSDLYRGTITCYKDNFGKKESITVIIKCSPTGCLMADISKSINLFPNEIEMFTKTLPAIYKILNETATVSSDLYFTRLEEPSFIILEDLKPLNYIMHERQIGFDLEHCMMIIERLAKFHAASVILNENDRKCFKNYNIGLFSDNEYIIGWIKMGYESLIKASAGWPGYENYSMKLKRLDSRLLSRSLDAGRCKSNCFNVLNHGDLWVNNTMFKYDKIGKLLDMRFIDFQLIKYSSPAIDLHYFIATSPTDNVREKYLNVLLERYYSCLLFNLTKLQYSLEKIPSFKEFMRDFEDRAFYGLLGAVTVAPLVKSSHRKDATFEDLLKDEGKDSFRFHCYNNDRYRKLMEHLLPYYDSLGIFD